MTGIQYDAVPTALPPGPKIVSAWMRGRSGRLSGCRCDSRSSRETARLMGLGDDYKLPKNYNEAYHLTGDGVAVPVVRHLAQHIFEPLLLAPLRATTRAAA